MTNTPNSVMLFAAGFGTRMGELTKDRPKPLIKVAGKPLLDHALEIANSAGIETKVVNAHYKSDQIVTHLKGRDDTRVVIEEPDVLDTGGGLRNALPLLSDGPVFTMNTDAVWTGANPIEELRAAWDPDRMDALLLLIRKDRAVGYTRDGDFMMDEDGRLTRGPGYVYSGVQILRTEGLKFVPDRVFSLNILWDSMLLDERIFGVVHDGGWADVGHPDGITLAEGMLAQE